MDVLRDKEGLSNVRLIILVFVVLSGIAAALLYFPPIPTRTEALKTSGEITFADSAGNPLSGAMTLSGEGISSGPPKPNVNLISWTQIPNATINYDALSTKSLSINLRISGDSPKGTVVLENYGTTLPGSVNITAPETPVKYVEINSSSVSFADAGISIKYTDAEVSGLDVNNLAIYYYDGVLQAWTELPTSIDIGNNILTATVNSLGFFSVSTRIPQGIEVHDTNKISVISNIKIYDEAKTLKKEAKTDKLSTVEVPDRGELEVDALASKNVAVKLKVNKANKGAIILDDFGKKNPSSIPLPGMAVKFVEIGASGISFSSANITIRYTDAELIGGSEDALTIYHWNGASWDAVPTVIDKVNKTLSASTASLSLWGVATLYRQALRCDAGTSIGADTTNFTCTTASTPYDIGLLLDNTAGISTVIRIGTAANGPWIYAYFINNTAFYTDVNVTGYSASISMRVTTSGRTDYGWYELGYYDPNGASGNFVGLFNSTAASTTATAQTSYAISFNGKSGVIPANKKLAIRVWTNATGGTDRPYFYSFSTAAAANSSFDISIAYANSYISGYVTNKSSGLPLSGATVQTNTSLTTTTNASGGYNFTGLSNGTYNINASLQNYATNSINVTINDNNNNTANISLTPLPTYLLSGYVTNASNGAAISGATITTNTSQTTTTNATGYYNFTLSNGTYIITASMAGYSGNSTTQAINGAAVSGVNIMLTPTPPVSGKILVATNRFVILDDPNDAGGQVVTGSGFQVPTPNDWGSRSTVWAGIATTINATAMYIDNNGFPVSGKVINFTIYWPNGTALTTVKDTTNSRGLANFSYNLDNKNFYGRWAVRAENGSLGSNTSFIYNWWGCSWSGGTCGNQHSSVNPTTGATANSPYLSGRDTTTTANSAHTSHGAGWTNSDTNACTHCHQSFDNNTGDAYTARYDNHPADVHRNISCDNANCHGTYTTHGTNMLVYSCYNSGCHGNATAWDRTDISNKSTLNSATVSTAVSIYSYNNASTFNATFHTPSSTVPCIICHGPMHNISKPDQNNITRFTRNNITEDSQCTTCHSSYTEHNSSNTTSGGVNCTLCHSDDVHDIQVFAQNATYVDLNRSSPNPARGNCTNCHQNATFFAALEAQPKAGNYTGRDPPQVAVPLEHSNDPSAGAKWKQTYWTTSDQLTWCIYCHGDTKHSSIALGRPASWDGNNNVNSSLTPGSTTWCAGCHWKGYASGASTYNDMVSTFTGAGLLVPPEISGNSTYGANTSIYEYTNHSLYTGFSSNLNDSTCDRCHGYNYPFTTITQLMHNQSRVGGANCADCHDIGGIALLAHVNVTAANDTNAIHKNLNINAAHVLNLTVYYDNNKRCWACHGNGSEPSTPNAHPTSYKMPDNCTDCHIQSVTQNFNFTPNNTLLNVTEHYWNAADIHTPAVSACYACHNRSEMLIPANDPDAGSGAVYGGANGGSNSSSHYGKKRADLRIGISANCSYCHQNTSTAFATAMLDPAYNSSISNHSLNYPASNPPCTQCHNTGWIHNSTLIRPVLNLPNSSYCLACHGTGGSATIKNLERHNSTSLTALNCTNCHLNTSRSIHPVRYLQQDGSSFSTLKTNAVNCTTCHQGTGLTNFSNATKIPTPINHSTNPYNGSLWNSTPGYWTNTSPQSACNYCHNKSALHNSSGLGYISLIQGGNTKNQSLSGGYWCANCHYNGSAPGGKYSYNGNLFTPHPPEVNNKSGLVPQSARDGTSFINHSWALATSYDDARCKACHNNSILDGGNSTSRYFSHDVRPGGPDCLACHDINGTGAPPDKKINASAMLLGVHKNLNQNATNTTILNSLNKGCWACHGIGTEPTGHPANYKSPYACVECHNATTNFTSPNITLQNEITRKKTYNHIPYNYTLSGPTGYGYKITSDYWNTSVNCTACHSKSTVYFNVTFTTTNSLAANISHYANKSNLISPTKTCTLCHKSPENSTNWYANLTRHPAKSQNVSFCANCHNTNDTNVTTFHSQPLFYSYSIHGGMSQLPFLTFDRGFDWEKDDYNESGTIDPTGEPCYACHGLTNIGDIKTNIQSVKRCENCHMPNTTSLFTGPNNTYLYNLRSDINDTLPGIYSHTNYSNITGTNVIVPSQGGTATPTTCYSYNSTTGDATCHAAPYFNKSNFGGYYAQYNSPTGPVAKYDPPHWTVPIDRMPNTTNCLFCHNQSNITIRKGWGNATQVNAGNMFGNRYAISNDSCYACHTRAKAQPVDFHSSEVIKGGGPGCLDCHNNSNRQNYTNLSYIDGANYSNSIHAGINRANATVNGIDYGINASCWACHNSSGYAVPNNTHPDRRDTPYNCTACHLAGGSNAGAFNAPIISNHYRNGTNIRALDNRTSDLISCLGCHENVSGMITPNTDTDYGSFSSDGVGVKGGNASFYHYGANRSNFGKTAGSYDYCIYCHRNTTGEFNITFQDTANYSISNHSLRYNSSNPSCSVRECHNSTNSSLHGARLIKPNINSTPHNSTYCLGCHGLNVSNGTINYTGAVTTYKEKHNNTVNCTECHTGINKRNIHPMTYLQPNGSYVSANQTGVNCADCHQQNTLDSNLSRTPPKVPATVQHSDNPLNGSIWNRTQAGYWTNTSQQTMCNYCHGDTRHNTTPLGRPANWSGSNTVNSSITNNSNWCAGCHYNGYSSGGRSYGNMTLTFTGANRSVPPEITNTSSYSPYNVSGYYNHSLTPDYNDSTCQGCHGKFLPSGAKMDEFVHNISTGLCKNCHFNYNYMSSRNKPDKYVNSTMFNNSPHSSLACEDCHTKGHNNIGARKACEDCHAYQSDPKNQTDRHNITRTPSTYYYNGINVLNITDCTVCHDSTLYNKATTNYGYNKTVDCNYCHTYPDKTYS